jgi:rhomboid family protein
MAKLNSPATFALILLNLAAFFGVIYLHSRELWLALGLNIYFLEKLYLFQPLTSIFMHAGVGHLLMNILFLYQVGTMSELYLGTKRFIIFYIVGGVLTQILSFIYIYFAFENEKFINLVDASGALCMLFGMLASSLLYSDKKAWFWLLCHRCCYELFVAIYGYKCRMVCALYRLGDWLFVR